MLPQDGDHGGRGSKLLMSYAARSVFCSSADNLQLGVLFFFCSGREEENKEHLIHLFDESSATPVKVWYQYLSTRISTMPSDK